MQGCPRLLAPALATLLPAGAAWTLKEPLQESAVTYVPEVSAELVDPGVHSRFHLLTTLSFADARDTFSENTTAAFEARAHIGVFEHVGFSFLAPFGLFAPVGPNEFFVGNLALGVFGGGTIHLAPGPSAGARLRLGGALDVYAPVAPLPENGDLLLAAAEGSLAQLRSLEPFAYLPRVLSFRTRVHAGFAWGQLLFGALELGLVPAVRLASDSDFLMWLSVALRASAHPIDEVEPFLEMGSALQVAGPGDASPPFRVTPGVRFHFWTMDPALMISFNFKEAHQILFLIDLAGVARPSRDAPEVNDRFWEQN